MDSESTASEQGQTGPQETHTPPPPPSYAPGPYAPAPYAPAPYAPLGAPPATAAQSEQMLAAARWQAAATRTYTSSAVLVLVLYFLLFIPGAVANIAYLSSAYQARRTTGRAPEGMGCLVALAIVFLGLPIAAFALFVLLGIVAAIHSSALPHH